jgi:hypothetical protein
VLGQAASESLPTPCTLHASGTARMLLSRSRCSHPPGVCPLLCRCCASNDVKCLCESFGTEAAVPHDVRVCCAWYG